MTLKRREQLLAYLDECSEDELIEEVLLPPFRQLGFHRITDAGHKDKALEYGKDVWMKYTLPTLWYFVPLTSHFSSGRQGYSLEPSATQPP
jgi:hypothetical protein